MCCPGPAGGTRVSGPWEAFGFPQERDRSPRPPSGWEWRPIWGDFASRKQSGAAACLAGFGGKCWGSQGSLGVVLAQHQAVLTHSLPPPQEKERQRLENLRRKEEAEQLRRQKVEEDKRRRLEEVKL